jgi:hypothetical protein
LLPVAEIGLDGASVMAVVGELEPTGMPQHVGVDKKAEFRSPRPPWPPCADIQLRKEGRDVPR